MQGRILTPLLLAALLLAPSLVVAQEKVSLPDLLKLEKDITRLSDRLIKATVGLRVGRAQGSGVLVKGGYVLTAGHVTEKPEAKVVIILHDGTLLDGVSLGVDHDLDVGLVKITDKGDFKGDLPVAEMGKSQHLEPGDWCLTTGHPGGYQRGRPPVMRTGRVRRRESRRNPFFQTDCTIVGGDSGGPLFDLEGRIIGIHSRITTSTSGNFHIPIDHYLKLWRQLVAATGRPVLGVYLVGESRLTIDELVPKTPAVDSGLKSGDVITALDGKKIKDHDALKDFIDGKIVGDKLTVTVRRGKETKKFDLVLGANPERK